MLLRLFYFTTFLSACRAEPLWTLKAFSGNTHGEEQTQAWDTAVLVSSYPTSRERCGTFLSLLSVSHCHWL